MARANNCIRNRKGFTLVELMVVLAIIAILSSAAVFSIIGYIDRARFDKNEQNAESMYQAVQTALGRKRISGEQEQWIRDVLMTDAHLDGYDPLNHDKDAEGAALDDAYNRDTFRSFPLDSNTVGDSVHMRYFMTYIKDGTGEDNEAIRDLVGGYFYDTTILDATFTIEFDVEKTIDGNREVHYSANAYAVFYDERRSGWDEKARKESSTVPWREAAYRTETSLVGYYNGIHPAAVDSVYTPLANDKMEFAELTLRNGEKLELSFSAINGDKKVTGIGEYHVHYTACIYDQADSVNNMDGTLLAELVISEAALTTGKPTDAAPVDYTTSLQFDPAGLKNGSMKNGEVRNQKVADETYVPVVYTMTRMKDDADREFTRYKASTETTALVYVKGNGDPEYDEVTQGRVSGEMDFYRFPLTVSYVINEYDGGIQKSYVSYAIALDAMMNRYAIKEGSVSGREKVLDYSIARLLSNTDGPKNIHVSMKVSADAFTAPELEKYNETANLPASEAVRAKRAYDDPVYLMSDGSYQYKDPNTWDEEDCARRDWVGYAVCNTFFGDLGEGSFGNTHDGQKASITSFRHLSNMRYTTAFVPDTQETSKKVTYEIKRDLNWYRKDGEQYTSEVEVYGISNGKLAGFSPAGEPGAAVTAPVLVSWPALPELAVNQVLVAKENTAGAENGDRTSVIRNVQMRRSSFMSTDGGYGFICKNTGTLGNLRCENFCLSLEDVADGAAEPKSIAQTLKRLYDHGEDQSDSFIDRDKCKLPDGKDIGFVPIGGLVGLQNGTLGLEGNLPKEENTIKMSNPVVLAGIWSGNDWKKVRMYDKDQSLNEKRVSGIGGVIGYYSEGAASAGDIVTDGKFAVAGAYYIGGVIGNVHGGVDARLHVESKTAITGTADVFPQGVSCLVMGRQFVGGAVGYAYGGYFAQETPMKDTDYRYVDTGEVQVTEQADAEYGINVDLAEGSYVRQYGGYKTEAYEGVGGAAGQICSYVPEKILSIRVRNAGYILSSNSSNGKDVGGAIGYLQQGSAKEMYIRAENTVTGRIGTKEADPEKSIPYGKCWSAAAGIACIKDFGTAADTYVFHVSNEGVINANTDKKSDYAGVGGAIGVYHMTSATPAYPRLFIRAENSGKIYAVNNVNSQEAASYWNGNNEYCYGVGGAAGALYGLQNGSHIYSLLSGDAAAVAADGNNVGGAVGQIKKAVKGTAAADVSVTADLAGVKRIRGNGINIGGCIGNLRRQSDYSKVATIVTENVEIHGYRNVGGVIGCDQQEGTATGAQILLKGAEGAPVLTITGSNSGNVISGENYNIGGAVGVSGVHGGVFSTQIHMPDQSAADKLVMDIDGGRYVGGMTGCFYLYDLQGEGQHNGTADRIGEEKYSFLVTMHPSTTVTGMDVYVGGAIGYVGDAENGQASAADFAADVQVMIPVSEKEQVVQGTRFVGGAIGAVKAPNMSGTITSRLEAVRSVCGTGAVGGAIGYANIKTTGGEIRSEIAASNAVVASGSVYINNRNKYGAYVGGCVGALDGSAAFRKVSVAVAGTEEARVSPVYGTASYMGGCIGMLGSDANTVTEFSGPVITEVAAEVQNTENLITAPENKFSCVGGVVGWLRSSTVEQVNLTGNSFSLNVAKASYVGGLVGQISDHSKVGQLAGGAAVAIRGYSYVGGLAGWISDNVGFTEFSTEGITAEKASVKQEGTGVTTVSGLTKLVGGEDVSINAYSSAGGYVGSAKDALLGAPAGNGKITVEVSNMTVGGFFGEINHVTVGGTPKGNVVSTNIQSVTSGVNGSRTSGGTGGFIGVMLNDSLVNCGIEIRLASGSRVSGGWNTGGAIGYIGQGDLNEAITVTFEGGQVQGNCGCIGGVIGSYQIGKAPEKLTTNIIGAYGTTQATTAVGGETNVGSAKGIGGVIGQIGGGDGAETEENRKTEVTLGTLLLNLDGDMVIKSGYSSVGGLIGQCETIKGTIENMEIRGQGNVEIAPDKSDAYDVGGFVGYMFGTLKGTLTVEEDVHITVTGSKYVGGCFGGMDGQIGTSGASLLNVNGITSVTGNDIGVGGFIGAIGVFHDSGYINGNLKVNLEGAQISGTTGTGGLIGCAGFKAEEFGHVFGASFHGEVEMTFANTTIYGKNSAGGIFGAIKEGYDWDDDATLTINVEENSSVSSGNKGTAGGMCGNNEGAFLSTTVVHVSSGVVYRISAPGGYAGGIMGTNANVFGRSEEDELTLPTGGGRIVVEGSKTGMVLGLNTKKNGVSGKCGIIAADGDPLNSEVLVYHIKNVELDGDYEKTEPRSGYVGKNEQKIYNVEIDASASSSGQANASNAAPVAAPAALNAAAPLASAAPVAATAQEPVPAAAPPEEEEAAADTEGTASSAGEADEAEPSQEAEEEPSSSQEAEEEPSPSQEAGDGEEPSPSQEAGDGEEPPSSQEEESGEPSSTQEEGGDEPSSSQESGDDEPSSAQEGGGNNDSPSEGGDEPSSQQEADDGEEEEDSGDTTDSGESEEEDPDSGESGGASPGGGE